VTVLLFQHPHAPFIGSSHLHASCHMRNSVYFFPNNVCIISTELLRSFCVNAQALSAHTRPNHALAGSFCTTTPLSVVKEGHLKPLTALEDMSESYCTWYRYHRCRKFSSCRAMLLAPCCLLHVACMHLCDHCLLAPAVRWLQALASLNTSPAACSCCVVIGQLTRFDG
jgi:hypothetical protein